MDSVYYQNVISKEEINACPISEYKGPIIVVNHQRQLDRALDAISQDLILGLDTETRPAFAKIGSPHPIALLQLCGEKCAVLVRVQRISFSNRIKHMLSNPKILKVGVGIADDMRMLRKNFKFDAYGLVDLANAAKKAGIETFSLRALAANFLSIRISKAEQCSNWEAFKLSKKQIRYAATDAWAGREIYLKMLAIPEFTFDIASVDDSTAQIISNRERKRIERREQRQRAFLQQSNY